MIVYKWNPRVQVQARNIDEAKEYLEARIKSILLHPDGIDKKEIVSETQDDS